MIISFVLSILTINLKTKFKNIIWIIINLFLAFYPWLLFGFKDFLGNIMSVGVAAQGGKITDYMWDFLIAYDLKYYLIFTGFVLFILFLIFEKSLLKKVDDFKFDFKNVRACVYSLVVVVCLSIAYDNTLKIDFMQNENQVISNKELFKYSSNPQLAVNNFGTTVYFYVDVKGTLFKTNKIVGDDIKKLDEYFGEEIIYTNSKTGLFENKNLIVVMMESIGEAVFDEKYEEYFPTLHKLYNGGMSGVNNYSPKFNCTTGDSEMISQVSLFPLSTLCTVNAYNQNKYPESLFSLMKDKGYYTSAYHNYTDHYYTRSLIELNFGNEDYYGVLDLGMTYNKDHYEEWPSDLELIKNAIPKFIDKDKFASYIVTVTSHAPYNSSSTLGDEYLSLFDDLNVHISLKRYLSKVKTLDLSLEYLVQSLEESGKLKDTVIVLFGDHHPYSLFDDVYNDFASYETDDNQEIDRTPFIIYNSEIKPMKIEKYTSLVDIAPTLLNLFNVKYNAKYYMGNDIFNDYEDYVVFPDNSWQSSDGFYNASLGKFIPNNNTQYDNEDIIERNEDILEKRNISALAIKYDYFNNKLSK